MRTARGRMATRTAYLHFGLKVPERPLAPSLPLFEDVSSEPRFALAPRRVYWEDTDGGGIVYYAQLPAFLERARTEWLRSLGYRSRAAARCGDSSSRWSTCSSIIAAPARLDDELIDDAARPRREGAAVHALRAADVRAQATGDELVCDGEVRVACIDARTLRPTRLPRFPAPTLGGFCHA